MFYAPNAWENDFKNKENFDSSNRNTKSQLAKTKATCSIKELCFGYHLPFKDFALVQTKNFFRFLIMRVICSFTSIKNIGQIQKSKMHLGTWLCHEILHSQYQSSPPV